MSWLDESQNRFMVPILISSRTRQVLRLNFVGTDPTLSAELLTRNHEIVVTVTHQGQEWDTLADFDAQPQRGGSGYRCELCPADGTVYESRAELWRDHLFQAFLDFVNTKLAVATAIGIGGSTDAATWATLLNDGDSRDYGTIIPLWGSDRSLEMLKSAGVNCSIVPY